LRQGKNGKRNGNGAPASLRHQADLDRKLVYSLSKSRIPSLRQIKYLKKYLTKRELWALRSSLVVLVVCLGFLGGNFYLNHLKLVPVRGGEYTEGLVGTPQYVNPLYAAHTDVDSDLSNLIYSSLFERGPEGRLVKDLAANIENSDNKVFTITLRQDAKWHDSGMKWKNGRAVKPKDVLFTFQAIKNSDYKSPLRDRFVGVKAEKLQGNRVRFILSEPYAAFPELLTFGVLPAELWKQIPPQSALLTELNLKPIGSGPYQFQQFSKDKNGNIKEYQLTVNPDYYKDKPLVKEMSFRFFPNFEEAIAALNNDVIDGISYLPPEKKERLITPKAYQLHKLNIPQVTSVFLNQQSPKLQDKKIRQALALAIDRQDIVQESLAGEGSIVNGPALPGGTEVDIEAYDHDQAKAKQLLQEAGWESKKISAQMVAQARQARDQATSSSATSTDQTAESDSENGQEHGTWLELGQGEWRQKDGNYLKLELATVQTGENERVVRQIKNQWERIGVKTDIRLLPAGQVNDRIVDQRNFEAFFYSYTVNSVSDCYAFWHSSQAESGLSNITNYTCEEADKLLEQARQSDDRRTRLQKYNEFQRVLARDVPAIFMYSPFYTYVQSKEVKGYGVKRIIEPKNRFANIEDWYIKTGKRLIWE